MDIFLPVSGISDLSPRTPVEWILAIPGIILVRRKRKERKNRGENEALIPEKPYVAYRCLR